MTTIKISKIAFVKLMQKYHHFQNQKFNQDMVIKIKNLIITISKNGDVLLKSCDNQKTLQQSLKLKKKKVFKTQSYIGSDEVGTGDFFGPVVVCAAFVKKNNLKELVKLGVNDSKIISDSKIKQIAPQLMKKIEHEIVILNNEKYNQIHKKYNLNAIKALLHNQAIIKLNSRVAAQKVIIDQFVDEQNYFKYLSNEKEVFKKITLQKKAEKNFIGVACASIIARFCFLEEIEKISEKINLKLQLGAGEKVDQQIKKINPKWLPKIAKLHFKNYTKMNE